MSKLGLNARDWIWIVSLLLGQAAGYGAVWAKVDRVEAMVMTFDERLWELQGRRTANLRDESGASALGPAAPFAALPERRVLTLEDAR